MHTLPFSNSEKERGSTDRLQILQNFRICVIVKEPLTPLHRIFVFEFINELLDPDPILE